MKNKKESKAINSNAAQYIKSLIHPDVKILNWEVCGKWLKATLSSSVFFSVKNQSTD